MGGSSAPGCRSSLAEPFDGRWHGTSPPLNFCRSRGLAAAASIQRGVPGHRRSRSIRQHIAASSAGTSWRRWQPGRRSSWRRCGPWRICPMSNRILRPQAPVWPRAIRYSPGVALGGPSTGQPAGAAGGELGTLVKEIYTSTCCFCPPCTEIGRLWQINQISVAEASITQRRQQQLIMSQLYSVYFFQQEDWPHRCGRLCQRRAA